MLITDGVPYNFEEIFREYNWPADESAQALMPVRVFTYLLGREVADIRDIKWMACANKGITLIFLWMAALFIKIISLVIFIDVCPVFFDLTIIIPSYLFSVFFTD